MGQLVEKGLRNTNILDYTTWVVGTSGPQTGFGASQSTVDENYIISGYDPFGKLVPIWQARPDATSDADGGWSSSLYEIDTSKMYRMTTWVKRSVVGTDGSFYFGMLTYDSSLTLDNVFTRPSATSTTNPYFTTNNNYTEWNGGETDIWYLVVGHIWPAGSGTGSNHEDSGVYRLSPDGEITQVTGVYDYDCVWDTTNFYGVHRSYLYYSVDTTVRQEWVYPRFEVVDGTEPSLADLQEGYDSRIYDYKVDYEAGEYTAYSISTSGIEVNRISEAGITDGLVGYWPMDGDVNDYSGEGNDGTPAGIAYLSGKMGQAAVFNGISSGVDFGDIADLEKSFSASLWFKANTLTNYYGLISKNLEFLLRIEIDNSLAAFTHNGTNWEPRAQTAASFISTGTWYHAVMTWDGSTLSLYVNGEFQDSEIKTSITATTNAVLLSGFSTKFIGLMDEVKLFKRPLSAEEAHIEYDIGKVKIGKLLTNVTEVKES